MSSELIPAPTSVSLKTSLYTSTGSTTTVTNITISSGNTTVSLPAFTGNIYNSDTGNNTVVIFAGVISYTPEFLNTDPQTYILITSTANVLAINTLPTSQQQADNIFLCAILHPNGSISQVINYLNNVNKADDTLTDVVEFLNPTIRGCRVVPKTGSVNMKLSQNKGLVMYKNINVDAGTTTPNIYTVTTNATLIFTYTTANSVFGPTTSDIDSTKYDNGTGAAIIIPGSGYYTIQRIGMTFNKTYYVQYGNQLFTGINDALSQFLDINTNFPLEIGLSTGILFAYFIIPQGITDITLARIIPVNNFCEVSAQSSEAVPIGTPLYPSNNLSDLDNVSEARTHLGAGQPNGLATLDANGKIPSSQMPSSTTVVQIYSNDQRYVVNSRLAYSDIMHTTIPFARVAGYTIMYMTLRATIVDRNILYILTNALTAEQLKVGTITTSGIQLINLTMIDEDTVLKLSVRKSGEAGTDPIIEGVVISFGA